MFEVKMLLNNNKAFSETERHEILRVAEFIVANDDTHYYPLSKIKDISNCINTDGCLYVARYLCGEHIKLLTPRYCYIEFEGKELQLTQDEFKVALKAVDCPTIGEYGVIHNFSKERLNMYFVKTVAPDIVITELEL